MIGAGQGKVKWSVMNLFWCILCASLAFGLVPASGYAINLSPAERDYLQALGKVRMCVDPDWPPFERINEAGEHEGIGGDLLRLAASRLGFELELVRTAAWSESLEASKTGKCHILSFLNRTASRTSGSFLLTRFSPIRTSSSPERSTTSFPIQDSCRMKPLFCPRARRWRNSSSGIIQT